MKRNIFSLGRGLLLGVMAVILLLGLLGEAKAAPYYKGKVIVFVVPTGAGGGADMWGRAVGRHFSRFIPGNPVVVIRNITGAGGVMGTNLAYLSKPDGLTILVTTGNTPVQNITRPRGTDFKLEEMHPLYAQPEGNFYVIKPGLIKEPKDILTAKGLVFGHNVPVAGTTTPFILAHEMLGFECKMVLGYSGSGPARLAFLSGECNVGGGGTGGYNAMKPFIDKGEAVPLFQQGVLDAAGNIIREKPLPHFPTMPEFYQQIYGKAPSGPAFEAYKLVMTLRTLASQTLLLPPKTPAEVVNICRKAAIDMVKDREFLDDMERLLPGGTHLFGEDLARIFPAGVSGKPETVKFLKDFLAKKYGVVFD